MKAAALEHARVARLAVLDSEEAAAYLRISATSLGDRVKAGLIQFTRPAGPRGDRRFLRSDLDAYLASIRERANPSEVAA